MYAAIWCQNEEGLIGLHGKIPWHYRGDLQRFKRLTSGATIVMGRKTWESIGRPLPNRRNVVVTSSYAEIEGVTVLASLHAYMLSPPQTPDTWFIGGRRLYDEALPYCDIVDLTYAPDMVDTDGEVSAVYAPQIDEELFEPGELYAHEDEPKLQRRVYYARRLKERPYEDASNRRLQELGYLTRRSA